MHIVKRTEESVSNKSVTETHLRTESSTSDFAASCCTAQWLQSGLGAERTVATQQDVAHTGSVRQMWCLCSRYRVCVVDIVYVRQTLCRCGRYSVCVVDTVSVRQIQGLCGRSVRQVRCLCSRDCVCAVDTVHVRQTHCLCGRYSVCVVDTVSVRQIQGLCDRSSDFECTVATERA